MDGPGMEMLAKCIEHNVDFAYALSEARIADLERRIDHLMDELAEARQREWRSERRIRWLLGYGEEE